VAHFTVLEPHTRLSITAESTVEVTRPATVPLAVDQAWETVRERLRLDPTVDVVGTYDFLLDSPKVVVSPAVAAYAAQSFPPGRPLGEALSELKSRLQARGYFGADHAV
jgi:transglutaminase-like putative cysteine protease